MKNKIKIIFIIDSYLNPYAGTEGQLLKLINGLDVNGFQARMAVFKHSIFIENNAFPIPVDIININKLISPLSWYKLFRYLYRKKCEGYNLAHIYFNDASIISPLLLKILGYRVIVSRRDMGFWYTGLKLVVLRINSLFIDKVIANCNAVKDITIRKELISEDRVDVIYNGFQAGSRRTNIDYFTLNDINVIKIVLVANIRPIKRVSDAFFAMRNLIRLNSRVALYIIGDGDQANLKSLCLKLKIDTYVHFLGSRSDVQNIISSFDIGILCSESEGLSNTLIEYQMSGLPVICSNVGGNPEIIEHGVNGFLYEVGDVSALSNYLLKLCVNSQLRNNFGRTGKQKIHKLCSMENYIFQHLLIYKNLI